MGKKFDAQTNSSSEKYCEAVANYAMLVFSKIARPWRRVSFLYNLTSTSKAEKEYLRILKELPAQVKCYFF